MLQYKKKYALQGFHTDSISCLSVSPDINRFASGGLDGRLFVWSLESGSLLYNLESHKAIYCSVWSQRDPNCILVGCQDGLLMTVVIQETEIQTSRFRAHTAHIECLSLAQNGVDLATGAHNEVTLWHKKLSPSSERVMWKQGSKIPLPPHLDGLEDTKDVIAVSIHWHEQPRHIRDNVCDGTLLVSYLWHGTICWDLTSLTMVWRIPALNCLSAALSPDHCWLAMFRLPHEFQIYNIKSDFRAQKMQAPLETGVQQLPVVFGHDGLALIGGSATGRVRVWDTTSGDRLQVLVHDDCHVQALACFYDEMQDNFVIITGTSQGEDSQVCLWETGPRKKKDHALTRLARNFHIFLTLPELVGLAVMVNVVIACSVLYKYLL
ncbi:WD40 repeat-like protein [Dentipellis sp. KUC8613]|nr:WD40 repeat-like protein [Dentipellis sp. KUC8613]